MKCPKCSGTGKEMYFNGRYYIQITCRNCGGKGIVTQTNEEYMRSCSSDGLVSILCELVDSGILQEWRIKYHCADSDEDAVRIWLKQPHSFE